MKCTVNETLNCVDSWELYESPRCRINPATQNMPSSEVRKC
jgi:hypothetical protein